MMVVNNIRKMRDISARARGEGGRVVFVPTMGSLHEGHLSLLKRGADFGGLLVMSIFVNPLQFGPGEDYLTYPRDIDRDTEMAEDAGADVVFIPNEAEIYPEGFQTSVDVPFLGRNLCGHFRPHHFGGVTTVLLKLFNIVEPHVAIFGEKDYQQIVIVRRMVSDLNLDIEIDTVPVVRERDGLAMSSRNGYLKPDERMAAGAIYKALLAGKSCFDSGSRDASIIIGEVEDVLSVQPMVSIQYVKICDLDTLEDVDTIEDGALLAVAAMVGRTRLIDNCKLYTTPEIDSCTDGSAGTERAMVW